jgi:glycosyltransferase involved in cell wall biosynthesis
MTEAEVADQLRQSAIFLSFSQREGLPLPPAEAMACGCVVIGFHGFGGRDFGDNAIWVPEGDVVEFARVVESVLTTWQDDSDRFRMLTARASAHIRETYNADNTQRDACAAFALSPVRGPAGGSYVLSDSMWQELSLARRMLRRATRAANVLLRGDVG